MMITKLSNRVLALPVRRYSCRSSFFSRADDESEASLAIASFRLHENLRDNSVTRDKPLTSLINGFFPEGLKHDLLGYCNRLKHTDPLFEKFGGSDVREADGAALEPQHGGSHATSGTKSTVDRENVLHNMMEEAEKILELEELEQSQMEFERERLARLKSDSIQSSSEPLEIVEALLDAPVPDQTALGLHPRKG